MMSYRPQNNIHDYTALDGVLSRGGVAIVPTETVYGLAARPDNSASIDKIYALKGRGFDKPLALCVSRKAHYIDLVEWSPLAGALATAFWPGPLTLVLRAKPNTTLDARLYGQDAHGNKTIALRCAKTSWSPYCSTMPVALTSANKSGQPDARSFDMAYSVFGGLVDGAYQEITGAPLPSDNLPSTILALDGNKAKVLRAGDMQPDDFAPFDIDWQF